MTDLTKREAHSFIAQLDDLGEHIAREQDALLAKHSVRVHTEMRARMADLDVGVLRKASQASATRRAGFIWAGGSVALAAAALALIPLRGLDVNGDVQPKALSLQIADQHQD